MTQGRRYLLGAAVLLPAAAVAVALLPATTLQGINYRVTAHRIPAYVKTVDFLQRHHQYQLLVSRICGNTSNRLECVMALFDWTHSNVRQPPEGLPTVDDHPSHVVIRGYGTNDQMADVFSILSTYAGVPAFFRFLPDPRERHVLALTFVRLDGRWVPFDVEHHVVFRHVDGRLAGIDDLLAHPALADAHHAALPGGLPYSTFISRRHLEPFVVPTTLRGQLQQPLPRLGYELRRLVGLESR